jgi:histidine triad (HIT) family protein
MGAMADCIFCKIVAGELPSTRIHEDDRAIAIMDISPATPGHVLVVPRAHAADIHDISDEDVAHCAVVAKNIAARAIDRLGASGVTIVQSNGADAWQTVFHYHVHVIPRYPDDPLRLPWEPAQGDLDEIVRISKAYFSD